MMRRLELFAERLPRFVVKLLVAFVFAVAFWAPFVAFWAFVILDLSHVWGAGSRLWFGLLFLYFLFSMRER